MDANLLRLHDRHVAQIGHDFIRLLILQLSVRDDIDRCGERHGGDSTPLEIV